MIEKGLVYGRFQILHLKHVEYILAAKMRCKRLYIGITMSDDLHVSGGEEDNYRIRRSANPLTYIERYEMLRDTLLSFGVPREEFEIIPFPIDRVEYLGQYLPEGAVCFMSICDEWTANNEKRLRSLEFRWKFSGEGPKRKKGYQVPRSGRGSWQMKSGMIWCQRPFLIMFFRTELMTGSSFQNKGEAENAGLGKIWRRDETNRAGCCRLAGLPKAEPDDHRYDQPGSERCGKWRGTEHAFFWKCV